MCLLKQIAAVLPSPAERKLKNFLRTFQMKEVSFKYLQGLKIATVKYKDFTQ